MARAPLSRAENGWRRATLAQLRAFVVISQCESLTEAADLLGMAQPTVSQHLRALEEALGCTLVERRATGIRLSDEGTLLAQRTRELAASLDAELRSFARPSTTGIRVAVCAGVPREVLDRAVRTLGSPKQVVWLDAPSNRHPALLAAGQVDAAVGRSRQPHSRRVGREPIGVLTAARSSLAVCDMVDHADLAGCRLAWFDETTAPEYARMLLGHLAERGIRPDLLPLPPRSAVLASALLADPGLVALRPQETIEGLVWVPLADPPHDELWLTC